MLRTATRGSDNTIYTLSDQYHSLVADAQLKLGHVENI